ncbi:VanZ family protein [Jeotgalibacillus sp. JSM ZJ347]|uniref:VanZ family protein n=1 Tax=Jeotgalibacillus sp. JSM ZJ347 TaxID=3342117 RepID=UPI0035A8F858
MNTNDIISNRLTGAVIRCIPLFILIGIIYYSSSQTYEEQSIIPFLEQWTSADWYRHLIAQFSVPYGGRWISVDTHGYAGFTEFLIRKGAHLGIFFLISFFMYHVIFYLLKFTWRSIALTLFLTLLIAMADEYHQQLTGGRTSSVNDVILDMLGGLIGLAVALLLKKAFSKPNI